MMFNCLLLYFNVLKLERNKVQVLIRKEYIMNSKLKDNHLDELFKAILCLENVDECYDFFEDLCTVLELKSLSQRMQVAKMLSEKKVYSDIVNETGASTATISRVNRSLNYGCDGYAVVFKRMKEKGEFKMDVKIEKK